jgi:four helix bundle protein
MEEAAERLVVEVDRLLPRAQRRARRQADHLERSADSVLFNMAEGVASFKPKMKIGAYEIARKEAGEVRAILWRLRIKRIFTEDEVRTADQLASTCIGMLTNAITSIERRLAEE